MHQANPDMRLQHGEMPNADRVRFLAGASALLMLAVVAASADIRAGGGVDVQMARGVHRATASTVALLVFALAVLARKPPGLRAAASAAFVLMLALSAVGWAGGTDPGPAAAVFNQAGGLALTALLAGILGRASPPAGASPHAGLARAALLLAALQAAAGGALSVLLAQPPLVLLIAHAVAGIAVAAAVAALGARYAACALPAPLAGLASVLLPAAAAQAGHALAAALLLAAAAYAHGRVLSVLPDGRPKT
jgi:hypothetical protein